MAILPPSSNENLQNPTWEFSHKQQKKNQTNKIKTYSGTDSSTKTLFSHIQKISKSSPIFFFLNAPAYLSDLLHLYSPSRSLRSSADTYLLTLPFYKRKTKDDRAFFYSGPSVWNSLPLLTRNATTIDPFKSALKTHLFNPQDFD